jgi:hypothetical protein
MHGPYNIKFETIELTSSVTIVTELHAKRPDYGVGFLSGGGDLYLYHGFQTGCRAHPLSVQLLLHTWVKRPELDPKFFPVSSVEVQEMCTFT